MFYQGKNKLLFYYRLFFISLFLLLGITGIGIIALECFADMNIVTASSGEDKTALYISCSFLGLFGLITALIMINLMREKRGSVADRRQHDRPLDFADRRTSSGDRRG